MTSKDIISAEKPDFFPEDEVPWSPMAGFILVLVFLGSQAVFGSIPLPFLPDSYELPFKVGLSNLLVVVAVGSFIDLRAGSFRRGCKSLGLRLPGWRNLLIRPLTPMLLGIPALLGWALIQQWALDKLGLTPPRQMVVQIMQDHLSEGLSVEVGLFITLAVVVAPITEEVLFRGVLYLPMRERFGTIRAALAASLLFAAMHGYAAGFGHLFILALVLTWLLENTRTMLWPILIHALHNGAMIAILILSV
ncbi:MAG: CPBP family intramembrane glutamic endopeptidase [Planctomycetota bacterium]